MTPQIIEGTWEEIKMREAQLAGRMLRVTVLPLSRKVKSKTKRSKIEIGVDAIFGKYADIPGGSEQFAIDKQAEIDIEDRVCG